MTTIWQSHFVKDYCQYFNPTRQFILVNESPQRLSSTKSTIPRWSPEVILPQHPPLLLLPIPILSQSASPAAIIPEQSIAVVSVVGSVVLVQSVVHVGIPRLATMVEWLMAQMSREWSAVPGLRDVVPEGVVVHCGLPFGDVGVGVEIWLLV